LMLRREGAGSFVSFLGGLSINLLPWYREMSNTAMPEIAAIFFITVSLLFISAASTPVLSRKSHILSGIAIGLLVGVKIHYAIFALLILHPLFTRGIARRERISRFCLVLTPFLGVVSLLYLAQDTPRRHIERLLFMFDYYQKAESRPLFEIVFLHRLDWSWLALLLLLVIVLSLRSTPSWVKLAAGGAFVSFVFFESRDFSVDRNVVVLPVVMLLAATVGVLHSSMKRFFIPAVAAVVTAAPLASSIASFSLEGLEPLRPDSRIVAEQRISCNEGEIIAISIQTQMVPTQLRCDVVYFDQLLLDKMLLEDLEIGDADFVVLAPSYEHRDITQELSEAFLDAINHRYAVAFQIEEYGSAKHTNFYAGNGSDLLILEKLNLEWEQNDFH